MGKLLQPLSSQVPIVDPKTGNPTPVFQRLLQRLGLGDSLISDNGNIDLADGAVSNAKLADMASKLIKARKTAGSGPPEDVSLSDVLDFIGGAARGDILYRGAGGWARLGAGTAGKVLQTNGAGADPTWVTPSAGGGSIFPINAPPFGSFTWVNQGTSTFTVNSDGSVTLVTPASASQSMRGVFVPLGGATYDHRIGFIPALQSTGFQMAGVALRNSVSGQFVFFGCYRDASTGCLFVAMNFPSATGAQTNVLVPATPSNWTHAHPTYVHLKDDGVNRTCSLGLDPWHTPFLNYSLPSGSFIVPDQIGLVYGTQSGAAGYGMTCFDWR